MDYCWCLSDPPPSNWTLDLIEFLESDNFTLNDAMLDVSPLQRAVQILKFIASVGAIVMNSLSLLAIIVSRCAMSANARLVTSLALSDLLCGVCGFLDDASVATIISCSRRASKCMLISAHLSALLTILGLAVDHYLAICKPLYHRSDDNVFRVSVVIVLMWIFSCAGSLVDVCAEVHETLSGVRFA